MDSRSRISCGGRLTSRIWMLVCLLTLSSAILAGQPKPLSQQVTIYRDAYGTPHVFGRTDVSTVFGFAYAQAEDNFPRMEENFILALGRASEVFGEDFLEDDRLNRTLEIEGRAREDYQQGSPKLHELCAAFADGVNYYLSRHPDVKPRLLTKIEPWYPQALMRYSYYQEGFAHDPKLEKAGLRSTVTSLIHDRNGSFRPSPREALGALHTRCQRPYSKNGDGSNENSVRKFAR